MYKNPSLFSGRKAGRDFLVVAGIIVCFPTALFLRTYLSPLFLISGKGLRDPPPTGFRDDCDIFMVGLVHRQPYRWDSYRNL